MDTLWEVKGGNSRDASLRLSEDDYDRVGVLSLLLTILAFGGFVLFFSVHGCRKGGVYVGISFY